MSATDDSEQFNRLLREAWINTRMEFDKTVVTVSSGGIGAIFLTRQVWSDLPDRVLVPLALSGLSFGLCVFVGSLIFRNNADYIEALINKEKAESTKLESNLLSQDRILFWGFMVAFAFVFIAFALSFPQLEALLGVSD